MKKCHLVPLVLGLALALGGCGGGEVRVDPSLLPSEEFSSTPKDVVVSQPDDGSDDSVGNVLGSGSIDSKTPRSYKPGDVLTQFPGDLPADQKAYSMQDGTYIVTSPGDKMPNPVKKDLDNRVLDVPQVGDSDPGEANLIVATWYSDISQRYYQASGLLPIFVWQQESRMFADDEEMQNVWHVLYSISAGDEVEEKFLNFDEAKKAAEEWKREQENAGDIYVLGEVE